MTDNVLRPRLERLETLAKSLNAVSDEIGKVVQGVEAHLNETLHLGVRASAELERGEDPTATISWHRRLVYDRYGPKFRIYVIYESYIDGNSDAYEETLWANCPRDMKLLAFIKLPELLDDLAAQVEKVLEQVDIGYDAIQAMIPAKGRRPKA
jgi:hypothetical protein